VGGLGEQEAQRPTEHDRHEDPALVVGELVVDGPVERGDNITQLGDHARIDHARIQSERSGSRSQSSASMGTVGFLQKRRPLLVDTSKMANLQAQVVNRLSPRNPGDLGGDPDQCVSDGLVGQVVELGTGSPSGRGVDGPRPGPPAAAVRAVGPPPRHMPDRCHPSLGPMWRTRGQAPGFRRATREPSGRQKPHRRS